MTVSTFDNFVMNFEEDLTTMLSACLRRGDTGDTAKYERHVINCLDIYQKSACETVSRVTHYERDRRLNSIFGMQNVVTNNDNWGVVKFVGYVLYEFIDLASYSRY
jgi:hypothetical protein